ncbi:hypothetical protein OS175_03325 [Marinicella sp. S1101]|uniref:hypothetical protein n=1 Tax=Marinicella marina TaxID=2996016 RepID=UPI002260C787|nr:hypothetical protein [Marinicella marina]MCX7552900.1 hypothetical protein [Marinicella marina]MDJ1139791.1 hypothetical protein [Marinicella marina]
MALINCPACRTKISSVAKVCPSCGYSKDPEAQADPEQIKLFQRRLFRDRMYKLRMFSYVAMTITMIGALPMLWDYIKGIESAVPIVLLDHWGIYAIAVGFIMYVAIRVFMTLVRRNFRANLPDEVQRTPPIQ